MPKESRKLCRDKPNEPLTSFVVAALRSVEQLIKPTTVPNSKPFAPPTKQFAMPFNEFNSRDVQRKAARSVELVAR
jgi:hypothetical protein